MSLLDKLRNLVSGPPRLDEAGDEGAEVDSDLSEETPAAHEDWVETEEAEEKGFEEVKLQPSLGAFEEAEAQEDEKDSEAARTDTSP